MILILVVLCVMLNCVATAFEDASKHINRDSHSITHGFTNIAIKDKLVSPHNLTYIDRDENMLRVPVLNNNYEEHKSRRKTIKKPPKRTIQKIIKKSKSKTNKLYLHREVTSRSTQPPKVELDKIYIQDEYQWKDETSTAQANHMRKPRKWNPKVARYPMPFQRFQSRKENGKRYRRSNVRDDVYILKDLDEIEFLSNDDGNDVVNVHVKKYW